MTDKKRSYVTVLAQIAKLQEEAAALRAEEINTVLAQVREKIAQYGLTSEDVFGRKRAPRKPTASASKSAAAKYQDPKTGATWSGKGRAPAWISKVKNRDRFLIVK